MNCVNHNFARGLAKRLQRKKRTRFGGVYIMLAKKCNKIFGRRKEAKSLDFQND
jgi:hypothetical protein